MSYDLNSTKTQEPNLRCHGGSLRRAAHGGPAVLPPVPAAPRAAACAHLRRGLSTWKKAATAASVRAVTLGSRRGPLLRLPFGAQLQSAFSEQLRDVLFEKYRRFSEK